MSVELTNVVVEEISVLTWPEAPANRRRIAMTKSAGGNMSKKRTFEVAEGMAAVVEKMLDGKQAEELRKSAGAVVEGVSEEVVAGLALIKSAGGLPTDKAADLLKAIGIEIPVVEVEVEKKDEPLMLDGYPVTKSGDLDESRVPENFAAVVKQGWQDRKEKLALQVEKKEGEIRKSMGDAYSHVPGDKEALFRVLKAADGNDALKADLDVILKATNGVVKESGLFVEQGTSASVEGSAVQKFEALVTAKIAKSEGKLSKGRAWTEVCNENPELYQEYMGQKG